MIGVLVAMSAGPASAEGTGEGAPSATFAGDEVATVLRFQNDQDAFTAFPSQNVENTFDPYYSQAADDFVVPAGGDMFELLGKRHARASAAEAP